jgi:hypothetical protein
VAANAAGEVQTPVTSRDVATNDDLAQTPAASSDDHTAGSALVVPPSSHTTPAVGRLAAP